jgi:hypothetical protein
MAQPVSQQAVYANGLSNRRFQISLSDTPQNVSNYPFDASLKSYDSKEVICRAAGAWNNARIRHFFFR